MSILPSLLFRIDRAVSPSLPIGRKVGVPCGESWISHRYNCSSEKRKVATKRLKENPELKEAYADRLRQAKGLKPKRKNLTKKFDRDISKVRKIKDPQKRYDAAQKLLKDFDEKYAGKRSRGGLQSIRRKIRALVTSTRNSAGRKAPEPTRRNAPFMIPTNKKPERVRGPGGIYLSIDSLLPHEKSRHA